MVMNSFVLEQLKEKMEVIIQNQPDMILDQCMMLANQKKTMERQQSHAAMMGAKLARPEAGDEERNQYLSRIECNTKAAAYFAADCIRQI